MRFLVNLIMVFAPLTAFGWGELGHKTVAEIAQKELANDHHTMGAIRSILGVEALALASVWPDEVRDDKQFNGMKPFHFVTIYEKQAPDQECAEENTDDAACAPEELHDAKSARVALEKFPGIISNPESSQEAKMIALRYIIHIMGDIHQPLHVGNEFDRGGNSCVVRWQSSDNKKPNVTNLHKVWDTIIPKEISSEIKKRSGSRGWFGYQQFATALMESGLYSQLESQEQQAPGNIDIWINQSASFRSKVSYPDPNTPDNQRVYCKNSIADEDIPTLDKAYADKSKLIVKHQLILGGIRLSRFLKETFKDYTYEVQSSADILKTFDMENNSN